LEQILAAVTERSQSIRNERLGVEIFIQPVVFASLANVKSLTRNNVCPVPAALKASGVVRVTARDTERKPGLQGDNLA